MSYVYETKQPRLGHLYIISILINKKDTISQKIDAHQHFFCLIFQPKKTRATRSLTFLRIINYDSFQYLEIILRLT
jgi:hypothetical protein